MNPSAPATSSGPAVVPLIAPVEIDASCRLPLFVMFVSAAVWLVIASVFGLISTLKFHNPNFLADCAALTYGRTRPAYLNSILYGFCVQAGTGVALWIIARLSRTNLVHRWVVTIGAMLWNLGVTVGVMGILIGDGTGFENLDLPAYAAVIMFLGYLLFGIWTVLTFHQRRERQLFVAQWFLLAALFWFPWIYSTAYLLLVTFPVRGVAQSVIAWWFSNNLLVVWMELIGLATIFYFISKLTHRELYSSYLALFTFWMLLLFGSWGGIPNSAPVPAWMPALSTAATVLMLLTLVTVALNVFETLKGQCASIKASVPFQFIWLGLLGFILATLINIVSVLPMVSPLTDLTWFATARTHANFYAFFSLTMFGAVYYIVPRLAGIEFASAKLLRLHLWFATASVLLIVLPLAIGGLIQGLKLSHAVPFLQVSKASLLFLRISTMGDLLMAVGHVIFLVNLAGVVSRFARARAVEAYSVATTDLFKGAEAKP